MTQNNVKIAVTGGIGSGKSTVCKIIAEQNLPVISCDEVYAELLCRGEFVSKLASEFGEYVVLKNGTLDRKKLSEIVFNDTRALERLNKITHPAIMEKVLNRAKAYKLSFCEVPLLFENGYESLFDGVIVVLRSKTNRISSIMERDNLSEKAATLRIKSQFNYDICDLSKYYAIHNDGNSQDLRLKTVKIIDIIKSNV